MHILLTTYGLLLIFALFSFAQWQNAETMAFTDAVAHAKFDAIQETSLGVLKDRAHQAYRDVVKNRNLKDNEPPPESHGTPDHLDDTPEDKDQNAKRSSLLNVSVLFCEDVPLSEMRAKNCFQILSSLLTVLYQNEPFYQKAKQNDPNLEERFLQAAREAAQELRKDDAKLYAASQLRELEIHDKELKKFRDRVLVGTKSRKRESLKEQGYYPLIEFITINKNQHLTSIWLASRPLLLAIFNDEEVVNDICKTRSDMHNQLKAELKGGGPEVKQSALTLKKSELERCYKDLLSHNGIDPECIDFGVSLTTPPD